MDGSSSALLMDDTQRERVLSMLETVYATIDGYAIARTEVKAQRDKGLFIQGVQYGEINASSFASALDRLAILPGETFVDVGSGTGKAVLTAAALYPLKRATGVEIQKPLHAAALLALEGLTISLVSTIAEVKFVLGDAFQYDWQNYDVIFVNAAVFTQEMLDQVDHGAEFLSIGARILICTRPLSSPFLRPIWQEKLKTGKGSLLFRAYERVSSPSC